MRSLDPLRAKALRHCAQTRPPSTATVTVQHNNMQHEACGAYGARSGHHRRSCMPHDAGRGIIRSTGCDAPVAVVIALQHIWRKQCFRCSGPPPFFSCFREWLAPHVQVQRRRRRQYKLRPKEHEPNGAADGAACDICTLRVLHFCSAEQKKSQSGKRHVVHRASPHHCHFCARCSAPFTRAHAASTRMQSTLDTHAPRVRASPAMHTHHAATRAQKLGCRARVTGHWLPVGRLAAGTSGANALCNALATC